MSHSPWPRLADLLAGLAPDDRRELASALELPDQEPTCRYLMDVLANERLVRRLIRALSERGTRAFRQVAGGAGQPLPADSPAARALARTGLVLRSGAGFVLPLEFAFAAEELVPEESLLRLLARGHPDDLRQWRAALLGEPAGGQAPHAPSPLQGAADIHAYLTANVAALVAGLSPAARSALEEFGPADGLLNRRVFLDKHAAGAALRDRPLLPYRIPEDCPPIPRELLRYALIVSSGAAPQAGVYLHIPLELRPVALAAYRARQAARARAIVAAARQEDYRPAGVRPAPDGRDLLRLAAGTLACLPLRLTQAGQIVQADLERFAKVLGVSFHQAETLALFLAGLGLARTADGLLAPPPDEGWPAMAMPVQRALQSMTPRLLGKGPTAGQPEHDFLSFLRHEILAVLGEAGVWLAAPRLEELVLTRPGTGRWVEYLWGGDGSSAPYAAAVASVVEALSTIGAVSVETPGDAAPAVRLTDWGHSLLADEAAVTWPPPGPLVVTSSHEIYAPLGNGPCALARLSGFAELVATGPTMVFRLTPESLRHAASGPVSLADELDWLARQARDALPQNVRESLAEMAGRQGEVRLGPAGGFIAVRDPGLRAAIKRSPTAAANIVAEGENLLVLAPGADLKELAGELRHMGLLVEQVGTATTTKDRHERPGRGKKRG